MKTLLTLLLITICTIGVGQTPKSPYKQIADQGKTVTISPATNEQSKILKDYSDDVVYRFDEYNKIKIIDHINIQKQVQKIDSAYWSFVRDFLTANKVDFSRIANRPDSIRITPEGIFLKLKPKKK